MPNPKTPYLADKGNLVDMIAYNRGTMISRPADKFEVGVIKTSLQKGAQLRDLQGADKLAEEALALAWSKDPLDMLKAAEKMDQARKIREAVAKQLPWDLTLRIRTADALQRSALLQVVNGIWSDDLGAASGGLTDYKVARERFQLIEDDILGRPHGGPTL